MKLWFVLLLLLPVLGSCTVQDDYYESNYHARSGYYPYRHPVAPGYYSHPRRETVIVRESARPDYTVHERPYHNNAYVRNGNRNSRVHGHD